MGPNRSKGRRCATAAVAVSALVVIAGCSSSSSGGGQPTTASNGASSQPTGSSTGAAGRKLTLAQARHVAAAINLTSADLPGYTAKRNATTAADKANDARLDRCLGSSPPSRALVDQRSPDFDKGAGLSLQEFSSEVSIQHSARVVQHDLAAIKSGKAQPCFKRFINRQLQQQGGGQVSFDPVQVAVAQPSAGDSGQSFGYRFTDVAHAGSQSIPFFVYMFGWAYGQAEVSLTAVTISQPPASTELDRLESLLVGRAGKTA
jgi:hypothetical protein